MAKYSITLMPLNKYFFGGDMTFKVEGKRDFNERYESYIIESNLFPQQTSILGMMRYLLLSNNGKAFNKETKKIENTQIAEEIIGKKSFSVTESNGYAENDFKGIKSISPCRLKMSEDGGLNWVSLLPVPLDYGYSVTFDQAVKISYNGVEKMAPIIQGYDPKVWKELVYIGWTVPIMQKEIFIKDSRVGIDKRYDGKNEDQNNSFFKQISYCFNKKDANRRYAFGFEVEMAEDYDLSAELYNDSMVNLGGDNSLFHFSAEKIDEEFVHYKEDYNSDHVFDSEYKIVLLSDACLTKKEAEDSMFSLSETVPFRFMKTTVDTEKYTMLSTENLRSEQKYYLYKKGSVFFCTGSQLEGLSNALNKSCFKQIGYNHYQVIKNRNY